MTIILILVFSIFTVLLGRWTLGKWINHVGMYGATWGFTLLVFHSGLIRYYPLESETWMLIIGAWLAFLLGSVTINASSFALRGRSDSSLQQGGRQVFIVTEKELVTLHRVLWILNIVLIIHTSYEVYNVSRLMGGSLANVFIYAGTLYNFRVHEGLPGSIPYIGSLVLFATVLSGIYTSSIGRLKLVALIPFLVAITSSFVIVVRALALIVAILFIIAYVLNQKRIVRTVKSTPGSSFKRIIAVAFLIALLVITVEAVRTTRGLYEKFPGESSTLKTMNKSGSSFISPSVIMYVSVHNAVLNQYLKQGIEKVVWGRYTFAPLWRILSKLGFDTYVGFYQEWFYKTPVSANTGTYIRELHADFGLWGVLIVPYILGLVSSFYWYRVQKHNRFLDIVILTHIYVVVCMSWFVMLTQLAMWDISLICGIVIIRMVEKKIKAIE